jgi:hypothetical protein
VPAAIVPPPARVGGSSTFAALHPRRAGGVVFLKAANKVKEELLKRLEGDEKTGATIVLRALEEPLRQLATNAGLEGSVVIRLSAR